MPHPLLTAGRRLPALSADKDEYFDFTLYKGKTSIRRGKGEGMFMAGRMG